MSNNAINLLRDFHLYNISDTSTGPSLTATAILQLNELVILIKRKSTITLLVVYTRN